MNVSTIVAVTGPFINVIGEGLADLKRQRLADIDLEKLRLQRTIWTENLHEYQAKLQSAVLQEKAHAKQDLISRRLGNTTVLDSKIRAIDQDASNQFNNAMREYNRAIEEVALMERRVKESNRSLWRKLLGRAAV